MGTPTTRITAADFVTPPEFRGSVLIFSPDFFVPIVNQEQVDATNLLSDRGNRWLGSLIGRLKAGVSPAQAIADLNSIGSYLEKTYPKEDAQMSFTLAREGLPGDVFGRALGACRREVRTEVQGCGFIGRHSEFVGVIAW